MAEQQEQGSFQDSKITSDFNSLADTAAAISAEITDGASYPHADFELELNSLSVTAGQSVAELYIVDRPDGSNYEDYSLSAAATISPDAYRGTFYAGDSSLGRSVIRDVRLPAVGKIIVKNVSGSPFPSSSNVLGFRPWRYKDA